MIKRRKTRVIEVGDVKIGGQNPISVQSMTTTNTTDIKATVNQIKGLQNAGCDIIRVAVPDMESANSLRQIKKKINIPLIADIHFNHELAIESIRNGADAIRINPGNIGSEEKVKEILTEAKIADIAIRIGVNSGSLEDDLQQNFGVSVKAMTKSALRYIKLFEDNEFYNLKLSLKSSSVLLTIRSYEKMAELVEYPFHLGVTEAGTKFAGTIKSSLGIGALLAEGIGDTIRVSLTANPLEEIKTGVEILRSLGLHAGPEIISCPTCGRTEIDIISIANEVEKRIQRLDIRKNLSVAVMGCTVNGPGEAREADIGIAGGKGKALLFEKGEVIKKINADNIVDELISHIKEKFI
ncbi:MAG: flavodoxin-dependent (E)-4-hydroxy-3-methylbut-2-enyl-diphosphate synthase [Candidatus Cloacimonetes bacterium]|nr:flavodoxin-dependent (E)-4-hydroxy-3-methylbut-2-enyl-diphosphate synthase [Candidatus Cloacimonadota bacterium]MBS3767619.1 flavodoxin-dependent (E)-4-hydroxy-3-methylbut-2-enyl-diphosphate synthase [Candidatus Cloacimonadota bacterium]